MYPISIIDNFFEDPDSVANLSKNLKYLPSADGTWPGVRSDNLHLIDWRLFDNVCRKISHIFYSNCESWTYQISFQRVMPFSENQYDKKNCGWVHKDRTNFGGVIFLTREPDDDTGVTIYKSKNGGYAITKEEVSEVLKNEAEKIEKEPPVEFDDDSEIIDEKEEQVKKLEKEAKKMKNRPFYKNAYNKVKNKIKKLKDEDNTITY